MEENDEKIRIERILGLSVTSNAHFDCDSGLIAYPAGNTIVLLDIGSGTVVSHIVLETRNAVSSLALKGNSLLFVASDESNFLRVYNWQSGLVRDLSPCQNVICCAVSSALGILVTVGSDRVVSVWDFKGLTSSTSSSSSNANTPTRSNTPGNSNNNRGRKLASSSVSCKVSCVYFSPEGNYFVTGGTRHLKFWYLQLGKNECVLTGRPAILGSEHSTADFRDVITDGTATYAIANFDGTISATLCQFDERRFLDKWVQLKTKQSYCMCMDDDLIFIGCADGLIRCFRAGKLDFVATLPLPHHLGVAIAAATDVTVLSSHPPVAKFPSVVAIGAPGGKKIVAVYADHSLYAWDVQDVKRVGLSHSWLWHSGCIWDVSIARQTNLNSSHSNGSNTLTPALGWPSFVTCSNDDTVRIWDITSQTKSNLYSNECVDVKYISTRYLDSPLFISHGNGVRCVGIGSSFLCCGDRQGNLRLWGNKAKNEVIKIKAHKEEILSIDVRGTLIATSSRDGSVNLYNIGEEIERIAVLQEHNGSVTSVKFVFLERTPPSTFHVISCGADKSLVFRQLLPKKGNAEEFATEKTFLAALQEGDLIGNIEIQVISVVTSKTSLFDLETDSNGKHVLVACQDACVRVYNISSGKHSKTLRNPALAQPATGTVLPTIIKIAIDPSGIYVAASSTAKTITVFDYYKGVVVANLLGHSELATALSFTPDLQNLLSVGGDSCVFVWALPREMVVTMKTRMGEKRSRAPPQPPPKPTQQAIPASSPTTPNPPTPISNPPSPVRADYRFSFGQLPDWAKKQMKGEAPSAGAAKKTTTITLPQGKWSERVEQASGPMTIKSFYHSDTIVPVPFTKSQVIAKDTVRDRHIASSPLRRDDDSSEDKNSGEQSFEAFDDSMKEITEKNQGEEIHSSDFYSDVNKSTDGEFAENSRTPGNKASTVRSDTDTDESSSTRTSRSAPSKRIIAAYKDPRTVPYEIVRSRNAELIMSVKAKNREISKSRLELEKRLEDTRKKLQSIGYRTTSQSTQDLSHSFGNDYQDDSEENIDENGGIRRACSLSDLNVLPNPTKVAASSGRRKRSFSKHRKTKPASSGGFDSQNIITRSTSMSALMVQLQQSDSEPESLPVQPSYMSKTISSQGKSRHKPPMVVSAYSQENLRDMGEDQLRVSASEQNIFLKAGGSGKFQSPMARSKMTTPTLKKPQQVYGITKGLAVVTGVRQGGRDEIPLSVEVASASVEALRKSLDQVIHFKSRVSTEVIPDQEPISRILDDGLRSAQGLLYDSVVFQDTRPKIMTEHEPTIL